jgi:peptidoglycan/xylan/chitin deacetylase (PgdA/CDA1 family)
MTGVSLRARPPLVLAYHGVADVSLWRDHFRLFVRPRDLARQIETLKRWGYELTTVTDLAQRDPSRRFNLAALSFDDGFSDNAHALLPVLDDAGVTATVYVISGWLGRSHPDAPWARIMSPAEVENLAQRGIEIGAHTVDHVNLCTLSSDDARAQIEESKHQLEAIIGRAVTSFAYPFGEANARVIETCRDAGFTSAVRTRGRGSWNDPLDLPRQDVGNRTSRLAFYLKRDNRYERPAGFVDPLLRTWPGRKSIRLVRLLRSARAL